MPPATQRGTLHLVVGPSGVGKDTLIAEAAKARPDLLFPTRAVTRPAGPGEDHEPVTETDFAAREAAGAFLLSWRAHGLAYGIPASAGQALADGRHVMINVSRAVVPDARARLTPVRILAVTASPEALARRLAGRGRESETEIAARLRRTPPPLPDGPDVHIIDNGGDLPAAVDAFLAALAPAAPAPSPDDLSLSRSDP